MSTRSLIGRASDTVVAALQRSTDRSYFARKEEFLDRLLDLDDIRAGIPGRSSTTCFLQLPLVLIRLGTTNSVPHTPCRASRSLPNSHSPCQPSHFLSILTLLANSHSPCRSPHERNWWGLTRLSAHMLCLVSTCVLSRLEADTLLPRVVVLQQGWPR